MNGTPNDKDWPGDGRWTISQINNCFGNNFEFWSFIDVLWFYMFKIVSVFFPVKISILRRFWSLLYCHAWQILLRSHSFNLPVALTRPNTIINTPEAISIWILMLLSNRLRSLTEFLWPLMLFLCCVQWRLSSMICDNSCVYWRVIWQLLGSFIFFISLTPRLNCLTRNCFWLLNMIMCCRPILSKHWRFNLSRFGRYCSFRLGFSWRGSFCSFGTRFPYLQSNTLLPFSHWFSSLFCM